MFQNFSGWKILKIFLIFSLLFIGAVFVFFSYQDKFNSDIDKAKAATYALSGYAWSSNIGWVSLNCEDPGVCAKSNYQVVLDPVSGVLNGYAWSSNIGWIKFDPTGPYPSAGPNYSARINMTDTAYPISGWIRACSAAIDSLNCSGLANPNSGGWDGWIKFTDAQVINNQIRSAVNPVYGGWAWGSDVVGWLSFGGLIQGSGNGGGDGSWGGGGSGGDVRVPSFLTVSCSPNKTKAVIGEPIIWTATVSGGISPFSYLWSDSDGLIGTTNPITKSYLTKGLKTASVIVTDSASVSASAQCSLGGLTDVNIGGTIKEIQPR